jgi:hypothetical protein
VRLKEDLRWLVGGEGFGGDADLREWMWVSSKWIILGLVERERFKMRFEREMSLRRENRPAPFNHNHNHL